MKEYPIGSIAVFNVTWLSQIGEEAVVTGTPTITIKEYDPATDTWTDKVTAQNMTNDVGSTWFYEWNTTGKDEEYDYRAVYNAVVTGFNVEAVEDFRIISVPATDEQIKETRFGNERIDFTVATIADPIRGVLVGMLDYMTVYTKADSAVDWSSPTSTKTLYMWYDSDGNCISKKEDG